MRRRRAAPPSPAAARRRAAAAPLGGKTLLDELWELRLVEGALVCSRPQAAGTAPGRRARHAMVASGEKIFIHGGVGTLPPPAVRATSALHYMKGMVNWGAAHDATARPLSELFEFNARTYTWSRLLGGTPPAPRHSHACVVARGGRSLLFLGGAAAPTLAGVEPPPAEVYDREVCAWRPLALAATDDGAKAARPPLAPGGACYDVGSGRVLLGGGGGECGTPPADPRAPHHLAVAAGGLSARRHSAEHLGCQPRGRWLDLRPVQADAA